MSAILMYENGNAIGGEGHPTNASDITFDNTGTDLVSENVEDAIVEVNEKYSPKSVSVTADGTKTYKQLLIALWGIADISKVNGKSVLNIGSSAEWDTLTNVKHGPTRMDFSETVNNGTVVTNYYIFISSSNAIYRKVGDSSSDFSNTVPASGTQIKLTY